VDDSATRHAREAVLLGPASVFQNSPHHDQAPSGMRPGAHRPFERPLRPEDRGVFILKRARHFERTTEYSTAQMRNSGGASPASVVQSSPHHDQAPSRMRPGAHRPFARPARPEDRGVFMHFEECPGTARVPSSTMHVGAESATAWSLCRPASAAAALSLRKGLMLGA
jgi:hypothetical protein